LRAAPFKCNCPSYFNAIYRPSTPGAKLGDTYRVEYRYNHTHELRDYSNIGTQSKSKAIKARIKSMIMRGMSISAIMTQLTVDHARFTRLMEQGETQRLSRDDFITYDDVYNILYTITSKQMRKDANPIISAQLWMEELKSQGYFTYYDQENGLYHGFSSPWQLEQLRKWGDVFCFDGTHHASGYVIEQVNLFSIVICKTNFPLSFYFYRKDTSLFAIVVKNRETG